MPPLRRGRPAVAIVLCLCALLARIAAASPFAYIANSGSNNVSVIDVATLAVTATIPVGSSPMGVAVDPTGNFVYVTNSGSGTVSVIDAATNRVTTTIPVGSSPQGLAVVASTYLYVANKASSNISIINLATLQVANTVTTAGLSAPSQIAYNRYEGQVYVTDETTGRIFIGQIATGTQSPTNPCFCSSVSGPANSQPLGAAANPDASGVGVYVAFKSSGVLLYTGNSPALDNSALVGGAPIGVAVRPSSYQASRLPRAVVTKSAANTVAIIDMAAPPNGPINVATIGVGRAPAGVSITPDGRYAFVVNTGSNEVTVVDLDTNTVPKTIAVGANPFSLGLFIGGPSGGTSASSPPVFPVTVNPTFTATTVSATVQLTPRPQDIGQTVNIYVFAQAPSNMVAGAATNLRAPASPPLAAHEDDAIFCVLAQVDNTGRLVSRSASSLDAIKNTVLSQQAQTFQMMAAVGLNIVQGATFFVGYGQTADAMLQNGIYQTALSFNGTVQCTASLDKAPAPKTPGALSGVWWGGPAESGWGVNLTQRGSTVFAAWFTYDLSGDAKWYVSQCDMAGGATGSTGTCSGTIYQVSGTRFFGVRFDTHDARIDRAGDLRISFQNANSASMTYTGVAGQTRTVAITRQPLADPTPTPPAVNYTDLWWNPAESGWGIAMTQQSGTMFLAWYVYDAGGNPTWYVASCALAGSTCSGTLYHTRGPSFLSTFSPTQVQPSAVGSIIVSFIDANNAIISFVVNGVSGARTVTRQIF